MKQKTAIIGFGCAGYHSVKAMREQGYTGTIDVYTDSAWVPANPMLTTYYIYGKLSKEGTQPFGSIETLAQKFDFQIIKTSVKKILSEEKKVLTEEGKEVSYDQILIATGARAFVPPIPGADSGHVFPMRTMNDAEAVKHVLEEEEIKTAVVVGASMVGIKLVELFCSRGIKTTLVDMAPYIYPVSAVPVVADEIERRLKEKGVDLAFSKAMQEISDEDGKKCVRFADGSSLKCDLVMMCIGTRANTETADDAIKVNRGIVVDEKMQTNVSGIYSAGDCCEGMNLQSGETQIIGIWDNAAHQGETAGINMAGGDVSYPGNILHNITHFMGMDFIGYGDVRMEGEETIFQNKEKGQIFTVRMKDKEPICMNFLDSYGASGSFKAYMLRKLKDKNARITPIERVIMIQEEVPEDVIKCLMKEEG